MDKQGRGEERRSVRKELVMDEGEERKANLGKS